MISRVIRKSTFFTNTGMRGVSSLLGSFDAMVESLPMREAVRYKEGNVKCSAAEIKKWTDAHANALIEMGVGPGDNVIVWHPESAEKHIAMLSVAKIGATVVEMDEDIKSVNDLRKALAAAKGRMISFNAMKGEPNDKTLLLRKAIPEFYSYDDTYGQPFHSKHFPELQYFVHSGFDSERGSLQYMTLFAEDAPNNPVGVRVASTEDSTPLYFKVGAGGKSDVLTHKQVHEQGSWPFLKKLTNKEYFEC